MRLGMSCSREMGLNHSWGDHWVSCDSGPKRHCNATKEVSVEEDSGACVSGQNVCICAGNGCSHCTTGRGSSK